MTKLLFVAVFAACGICVTARDAALASPVPQTKNLKGSTQELYGYSGGGGYGGGGAGITTSHQSVFQVIKESFTKAMVGLVIFILGFPVLWFNERRQAVMWELFGKVAAITRTNVDSGVVDPKFAANMVHMTGVTSTEEKLSDTAFGLTLSNCAKLKKNVEMLQWVESTRTEEKDDNFGGKTKTTIYEYALKWQSNAVDSSSFNQIMGHENPRPQIPLGLKMTEAKCVTFGAFTLPEALVAKLCKYENCCAEAKALPSGFQLANNCLMTGSGNDLGNLRVTFEKVMCGDATVLAVQRADSFGPMDARKAVVDANGKVTEKGGLDAPLLQGKEANVGIGIDMPTESGGVGCGAICALVGQAIESGEEVFEIEEQKMSAKDILQKAGEKQSCIHKVLQVVGWAMIVFGLDMMLSPISTFFRLIPFLGTWVEMFGQAIAFAFSFLVGSCLALVTIAIAWLAVRPTKAAMILGAAAMCIIIPTAYGKMA